jgi:predicted transposase YbfD/YdcC
VIAVDGKALRGSRTVDTAARHVMAAYDQVTAVVLADTDVDGKTNEITRFRPLLDQIGDLRDTVITADALHCQREHVTYLAERGARWILTVKANQPCLHAQLAALPWLADLADSERPALLKTMADTPDGAILAIRTLQRVTARMATDSLDETQSQPTPGWISHARSLISSEIARHLAPAASRRAQELTEQEITLIWAWHHAEADSARGWINQRLDDSWSPLDLLAVLLPLDRSPSPAIGNDTLHSLDALIGLDELYHRLAPELDAPAADPINPDDERQQRILQALREHRQRHTPGS